MFKAATYDHFFADSDVFSTNCGIRDESVEALRLLDHTAAENAGPVLENKLSIQALVARVAGYFGIIVRRWMLGRKQL